MVSCHNRTRCQARKTAFQFISSIQFIACSEKLHFSAIELDIRNMQQEVVHRTLAAGYSDATPSGSHETGNKRNRA